MSLTGLLMLFIVLLALIFLGVGIVVYRKRAGTMKQPSLLGISALVLQLLLIILFFAEVLAKFNETVVDVLWWGVVLYGIVVGIKEAKNNLFVSFLSIFLSILLAIFMMLMTFITSM